jgi:hypothetical protein
MKPFTTIAAVVLMIVAAAHVYRLYAHLSVVIGAYPIPMWISWVGAAGAGILGVMLLVEKRR